MQYSLKSSQVLRLTCSWKSKWVGEPDYCPLCSMVLALDVDNTLILISTSRQIAPTIQNILTIIIIINNIWWFFIITSELGAPTLRNVTKLLIANLLITPQNWLFELDFLWHGKEKISWQKSSGIVWCMYAPLLKLWGHIWRGNPQYFHKVAPPIHFAGNLCQRSKVTCHQQFKGIHVL